MKVRALSKSMNSKNYLSIVLAFLVVALLVVFFPPGTFTWHRFFADQASRSAKLVFLLKVYLVPAILSFSAIVLFQLQMRMSMQGAAAHVIFPLAVFGSCAMLSAFRTLVAGVGGVPGYAMGMATAYTVMSRLYAIKPSGRTFLGRPILRVVWRGDAEALHELQMSSGRRPI